MQTLQNMGKEQIIIVCSLVILIENMLWNRNPIPSNEPVEFYNATTNQFKYYEIANEGIFVRKDENRERIEFWDNLFNEFKNHWNINFDFRHIHK